MSLDVIRPSHFQDTFQQTCRKVSLKETVAKEGSLSSWKAQKNRFATQMSKLSGDPNVIPPADPNCIVKMQGNDIE